FGFWYWSYQPHSYGYTATPYLTLTPVDPTDTFLVQGGSTSEVGTYRSDKTNKGSTLVDQGSLSASDPFMQVVFTHAGDYVIRVGSYIDYEEDNPYFQDQLNAGVFSGTSYDLNMTVQRHDTNEDAINLVGKTMTVVSGTGAGRTATIVGYDAQSNVYTLDTHITGVVLDNSSALEFSYNVQKEHPNYTPSGEAYDVVLSQDPGGTQVINVTPKATRTYNAALAFDADANYGQNEAVQVQVGTPQALIKIGMDPSGAARAGEIWTITIDGVAAAKVTAAGGEDAVAMATALETKLNLKFAGAGYSEFHVTRSGDTLKIETYSSAPSGPQARAFIAGFTIQPDTLGSATTLGRKVIELTGVATVGDLWTVTLNGVAFSYTAAAGDDLADVARALQVRINGDSNYSATVRNRALTVVRDDGASFSLT